jgi:hypothetical protein
VLCVAAIQALVSLNEQISTSLAVPDGEEEPNFQLQDGGSVASRQQQALDSSMALMRRLLVDAQVTQLPYYLITLPFLAEVTREVWPFQDKFHWLYISWSGNYYEEWCLLGCYAVWLL